MSCAFRSVPEHGDLPRISVVVLLRRIEGKGQTAELGMGNHADEGVFADGTLTDLYMAILSGTG